MLFSAKKTLQETSSEELILMLSKGNSSAFNELYRRFSLRILNYLLHMLGGNSAKAQDILQDVFLRVIEKADSFRPQYKAVSWLYVIAGNLCKNEYRRSGRTLHMSEDNFDSLGFENSAVSSSAMESLDKEKFEEALYKKLYQLPPEHRSIFLLRFQQELSVKEIADIMACPEGTVKSRLHYTVKKLAGSLQAYNPQHNINTGP